MHKFTQKIVELANVYKNNKLISWHQIVMYPFSLVKGTVNGTPVNIIEKTVFMSARLHFYSITNVSNKVAILENV